MKKLNVLADVDADVTWILTLVEVPEWITEAVAPTTAGEIITIGNNDAGSICLSRIAVMTEVWLAERKKPGREN